MARWEIDTCDGCGLEFIARAVDGGFCPECAEYREHCEACGSVFSRDDGALVAGIWLCDDCAAKFGADVRHIAEMCR